MKKKMKTYDLRNANNDTNDMQLIPFVCIFFYTLITDLINLRRSKCHPIQNTPFRYL